MATDSRPEPSERRTPLFELHCELGAKVVPFAGYAMPLHFAAGILREHLHTRAQAGLFDVSHMGQIRLTGRIEALERLCPIDTGALAPGDQKYTLLTNAAGGVLDDLMVSRVDDGLFLVVNAATKQQDAEHLRRNLTADCTIEELDDHALLALQGPAAAGVLARLAPEVQKLVFMTGGWFELVGARCYVTRSGYTGEDGFEISVPNAAAEPLARRLLECPEVAPVGLGARDSLRLEAGMCLYGHELTPDITPVEAGLTWAIAKRRRTDPHGFLGAETVLEQLQHGPSRKRVGLLPEGKAPVRDGAELQSPDGLSIGMVTSGGFSPSLNRPIAMGYVPSAYAAPGTILHAIVRDKALPVSIVPLPFVAPRYHRG
jgi:aminomethyltransferase